MPAAAPESILAARAAPGIRLDLAPFRGLLGALGRPDHGFPSVLVAGTNGKGSTAALLESIARAAGGRVGLTTSPHLARIEERIRIDGREVTSARLGGLLDEVFSVAAARALAPPTYFEAIVAAALLAFARDRVELAIVEVGLGGRLDATNAVEPVLSIVTRIAFDHRQYLGETLTAIAREKSGIFRRGVPALLAAQDSEADSALAAEAERIGAAFHRVADEIELGRVDWRGVDGSRLELRSPVARYELTTVLAGEHQLGNVATAVRAAELLRELAPGLDQRAIVAGVAAARWPGRLELVALPGRTTRVLLDGAHNPDGCRALASFLDRLGEPFDLLFGALADKAVGEMLPPLAARARRIVLTRPDSERALAAATLRGWLGDRSDVAAIEDPAAALDRALVPAPALLVVCGSLFLVGALRSALAARYGATLAG